MGERCLRGLKGLNSQKYLRGLKGLNSLKGLKRSKLSKGLNSKGLKRLKGSKVLLKVCKGIKDSKGLKVHSKSNWCLRGQKGQWFKGSIWSQLV